MTVDHYGHVLGPLDIKADRDGKLIAEQTAKLRPLWLAWADAVSKEKSGAK